MKSYIFFTVIMVENLSKESFIMNDIYTLSILISLAIFTFTTHITPGPTNIILLSSVLNFGYKKSLPYMIANIISYPAMMTFTALGIGVFLIKHPTLMFAIKIIGVIYLCHMAWKIATSTSNYNTDNNIHSKPSTFWQGLIYPWLNPKAWIVYTSMISIYITSTHNNLLQIGVIVFFVFISMIITTYTWSLGGIALKRLSKNERFIKRLNVSMSILLIISIVPILA